MSFALPPTSIFKQEEPEVIPEPVIEENPILEELFKEEEKDEPVEIKEPILEPEPVKEVKPEPPVFQPIREVPEESDDAVIALVKKYSILHSEYEKIKQERRDWKQEKEELISTHKRELEVAIKKAQEDKAKEIQKIKSLIQKAVYDK